MKKDTSISERIVKIIDFLKVNPNEFAKKLGYSRSQAIYDILNGKSKPSFDFFDKLLHSEYSELFNIDWIISGEGEMIKLVDKEHLNIVSEPIGKYEIIDSKDYIINIQREQIELLNKQIINLQNKILKA